MIEKMWEVYENLNEIVYVSDVDTYQLKYMNRKAREMFGNVSIEELQNSKCYKILQGCNAPCSICTNDKINVGEFYEWTYYNPVISKKFLLKDTIFEENGKRYRMEIAIDMGEQQQQEQLLKSFVNNEMLVNEGLKIALAEENPEKSIMSLLEYLGKAFNGGRAYIFEETSPNVLTNTYEWCANTVSVQQGNLIDVDKAELEDWYKQFRQNKSVIIKNVEDIKYTSPDVYNILKPQDITTLVVCPLVYRKKIIGFYGLDDPPVDILDNVMVMLNVMANFIVSIMNSRDLFHRIVNISYYDRLTGAGNRHAMEKIISELDLSQSIGIIYGDVMELKKTNDTKGHLEGDKLILDSYRLFSKYFRKDDIFRIGGDEFVVICSRIKKEDFEKRIEQIKNEMQKSIAKVAIGHLWKPICNEKIENLIIQADQLMYEEKRRMYKEKSNKCLSKSDYPFREVPLVGVHEYFMQQHSFHAEAFFRAMMHSSFGLSAFVGDLQSNIYYLSDNLRDILKTKSNMVSGLLHTWSVILSDRRTEFLNKWQYLLDNKQETFEFPYDVEIDDIRRAGVLRMDVRWNGEVPLFCTGIFIRQ